MITSRPNTSVRRSAATGLDELVSGVRALVSRNADRQQTARLVAGELARRLPSADVLPPGQRKGDPDGYRSHVLHTEPGGTFSIVALVWRPGQVTPIHDHVTWCVFGVDDDTAISIHVYVTDVSRIGSSVRRYYDQPIRTRARRGAGCRSTRW